MLKIHPKYFDLIKDGEIEGFTNHVDWYTVSKTYGLKESFMIKWGDYLHWSVIALYQPLRTEFIDSYSNKFNCCLLNVYICHWDKISDEFFIKYWDVVKENLIYYKYGWRGDYWIKGGKKARERAKSLGLESKL